MSTLTIPSPAHDDLRPATRRREVVAYTTADLNQFCAIATKGDNQEPVPRELRKSRLAIDHIFVADDNPDRRDLVSGTLRPHAAHGLHIIEWNQHAAVSSCSDFKTQMRALLRSGENILLITNLFAMDLLRASQEVEEAENCGTRKMVVSCESSRKINTTAAHLGLREDSYLHIPTKNGPHLFLEKLIEKVTNRPI